MRRPCFRPEVFGPVVGIAVGVLATACGRASATTPTPAPPAPGIAWTYLGRTPGNDAALFEACVPMPSRGYSRRLVATDPGIGPGKSPVITIDSQGC